MGLGVKNNEKQLEVNKIIWKKIGYRFGITSTTAITNDAFNKLEIIVWVDGIITNFLVQGNEISTNFIGGKILFSKNVEKTYEIVKRGKL